MIGLMILLFFAFYLAVSVGVTRAVASWAKRNQRSPWRWGGLAAFMMYNLVFWDFIPTLVAHKYYCATEAGFWVYKTPEQWRAEHPGVAETLTWNRGILPEKILPDGTKQMLLNNRFSWDQKTRELRLIPVTVHQFTVVDNVANQIINKEVIVGSGYGALGIGRKGSLKFWVGAESCGPQLGVGKDQLEKLGRKTQ